MPNGKCYRHGGATPAGIASPHFKTGKDSKYLKHLPASFAPHFNVDNPHLIALIDELALVDAGMIELLERGKTRVTASLRRQLWDLVDRRGRLVAVESRRRNDFARFAKAILMAVATRIDDPKVRGQIQEDVLRILAISQVPMMTGEVA
jgi:hypothetical protein